MLPVNNIGVGFVSNTFDVGNCSSRAVTEPRSWLSVGGPTSFVSGSQSSVTNSSTAPVLFLAGLTGVAAYADAKLHVRKDLADIIDEARLRSGVLRAIKQDRLSPWYSFEAQAKRLANEECLWYRPNPATTAVTYTWTQTYQHACSMAQFLLDSGVKKGELVAVYLINSPQFVFTMLATWAIGCAPALINYNLSGDSLLHCIKISASRILLVDEEQACQDRIDESRQRLERELGLKIIVLRTQVIEEIYAQEPIRPDDEYRNGIAPSFPVFLFYTSGTTGYPKACAFPTAAVNVLGTRRLRTNNMRSGPNADTWYDCMPMYHGTGCTTVVGSLISGTRLAIGRRFSVRNFWRDIHDSGANCFIYVGETARYLLAAPPSPLDRAHRIKSMYGNGMRPDIWRKFIERFNIPVVNEFFNSTEGMLSLLNVCRSQFHDGHVGHQGALLRWRTRDKIVPVEANHDDSGALLRDPTTGFAIRKSYEQGGEILIQCSSMQDFTGYWNNPAATEKKFERNVFRKGDLWYRTGDALRRDEDGRWFFLDRLGDTFRWKSENVSSQQVAEALGKVPGVVEVNVYGVELPHHDGRAGCAAIYIPPEARATFDFASLLSYCRKALPKYAVPVFLRLVDKQTPMHNNKQTKVPYRKEGVNPESVSNGDAGNTDRILWARPNDATYMPFSNGDWIGLMDGKLQL